MTPLRASKKNMSIGTEIELQLTRGAISVHRIDNNKYFQRLDAMINSSCRVVDGEGASLSAVHIRLFHFWK